MCTLSLLHTHTKHIHTVCHSPIRWLQCDTDSHIMKGKRYVVFVRVDLLKGDVKKDFESLVNLQYTWPLLLSLFTSASIFQILLYVYV